MNMSKYIFPNSKKANVLTIIRKNTRIADICANNAFDYIRMPRYCLYFGIPYAEQREYQ